MKMSQQVRFVWFPNPNMFWVLTALLIMPVASFDNLRGGLEREFFPAAHRVLVNSTLKEKTVLSYVLCGRDCSLEKGCKSFNYNKCSKLCELNNSTRSDHPGAFFNDKLSVYFDENKSTPLAWPESNKSVNSGQYRSCKELLSAGYSSSGVFKIYPPVRVCDDGIDVYCDMDTDGGGWIVFQRRQDGSVDFNRTWNEYQSGFGDISGEHWLGNDHLVRLTSDNSHGTWMLRIDLTSWGNMMAHAMYTDFKITGEEYTMDYGQFDAATSNASGCLHHNSGAPFSTKDHSNRDGNCAQQLEGAWWFGDCLHCHLNGRYYPNGEYQSGKGIVWYEWLRNDPLKGSSMKIRETG